MVKTSNLKNIGLNFEKIGFNFKKFGTTWFFYIYLKKKWKGLTNVFLKLILILVTLQSSSIIFFNFEKNFETTRFQLEKNWKNSLTPWLLLFKLKNTVLHWYFKEQKLYHTWKRLVQLQSWKKNWHKLEKNCQKLWKKLSESENNPV